MEYISLILSRCRSISWKVTEAKSLRKRCRQLGERVSAVEELVQTFQRRWSGSVSPQVSRALQRLYNSLMSAEDLVQKCTMKRVVNTVKYKSEFNAVDQQIRDNLRVLASAPHANEAPAVNRGLEYTVEEYDDDSDDDFGGLMPLGLGGAMAPAARMHFVSPQPGVVLEAVLVVENGNLIYAERASSSSSSSLQNLRGNFLI